MLRLALKVIAGAVLLVLVYLAVTFVQVLSAAGRDDARAAQAIVVLGAAEYDGRPSPVLRARLDHAADLYRQGLAAKVVVTGGKQVGDRFTEATASADYLANHGVPQDDILREVHGRSSWQQLAAAAAFLRKRGITRVVLVSDGFHNARIAGIASELGLEGYTSPATDSPIRGMVRLRYVGRETVAVALGRLVGYRRVAGIRRVSSSSALPGESTSPVVVPTG
ncbi:MAG TPA: YdcF family protein [Acidimicrobiales bacterium]|nr:YdcF family protein [Acidimicrobiales bacterium]